MESTKKQFAFIYLDKNGFYFYGANLANMVSLAFIEASVKDMEVINGASITIQVQNFITQYQIPPSAISIILSPNITFEKELIGLSPEVQDESIRNFVDTIPFDSVISKQYPIEKGVKVIGTNNDLYLELSISFKTNGSTIDSVVPYQMMGADQSLIRNLTTDSATQLLKRLDHLKQISMLTVEKEKPESLKENTKPSDKPKKNNKRIFIMAGVFIFLFIILGVMIVRMQSS